MNGLRRKAAAGALAILLGACTTAMPSAPGPTSAASPVDGVIVAIDASGLSDVRGFTLRLVDGSTIAFRLGQLENPTQFPPGHLKEHQATSVAVRVYFTVGPEGPVVYRLEDAPSASPAAT
ncbi:MAG: hypothetical protein HY263_05550 [Chloroflexi bacterium]|nr:hypothetical protein [Chloroflexota bacterium]